HLQIIQRNQRHTFPFHLRSNGDLGSTSPILAKAYRSNIITLTVINWRHYNIARLSAYGNIERLDVSNPIKSQSTNKILPHQSLRLEGKDSTGTPYGCREGKRVMTNIGAHIDYGVSRSNKGSHCVKLLLTPGTITLY